MYIYALILLTLCIFIFHLCSGYGRDITDGSDNGISHYSKDSVSNCSSESAVVKFYLSYDNVILDCLLTNNCPVDYFCVSTDGTNYIFCGGSTHTCLTVV
jgi:hypothetical protein